MWIIEGDKIREGRNFVQLEMTRFERKEKKKEKNTRYYFKRNEGLTSET